MRLNVYKKNSNARVRKFNGEYYLLSSNKNYSLNYLGAVVMKYIGTDITLLELVKKISDFYDEDDTLKIEKDIISFIKFLEEEGIIKIDE